MDVDHDPLLRIDQRQCDEGGPVLQPAQSRWRGQPPMPQAQPELLVLLHGFNNSRGEARDAYAGLRRRQRALLGDAAFRRFEASLGDDQWPGDADWGLLDFADALVYPQAVPIARDEVAPALADYLRSRDDVRTVHLLAHSMGCRVALETIADLAARGGPAVGRVCLMAAAVPVEMLCPGGRLAATLAHAREVLVLHSSDDAVLAGAFPIGQTAAGPGEGWFPEAVGLHGNGPAGATVRPVAAAGHGDYWGHSQRPAAQRAAEAIHAFFGFGAPAPRVLADRPLAATRALADRTLPDERAVAQPA